MPIYEYRCSSCGHQQEFLQKLSEAPHTVCTACGKPTFTKMLTAAGFQLKGSGWYATDFRNKGTAPAKSTEASGETKSEAKSEGKSEAKAEAKTEAKTETKSETKSETKAAPATAAKTP
jgi:putative FmdB family regulatory protein